MILRPTGDYWTQFSSLHTFEQNVVNSIVENMFTAARHLKTLEVDWKFNDDHNFMQFPINFSLAKKSRKKILQFILTDQELIVLLYGSA